MSKPARENIPRTMGKLARRREEFALLLLFSFVERACPCGILQSKAKFSYGWVRRVGVRLANFEFWAHVSAAGPLSREMGLGNGVGSLLDFTPVRKYFCPFFLRRRTCNNASEMP